MLPPAFFDEIPTNLSRLILEMQNWTIQDIARRLAAAGFMTRTADYQLYRIQSLQAFETDYKARMRALTAALNIEADKIFAEAAELAYVYDKALYEAKGIPFIPPGENRELQQLVYAATQQFKKEIGTLTNSRAVKMINPYGIAKPIPQFYADTLDSVTYQAASGVTSYDEAIRRAVRNMASSGLKVVRYETPGKRPVNRSIEAATRANVLTTIGSMAAEISIMNMDALGVDHVLVSAHSTARPSHVLWQGGIYHFPKAIRDIVRTGVYEVPAGSGDGRYRDLIAATRYTYADGLMGVHCRHSFGAFDIRYSTNPYSQEELKRMAEAERKLLPFKFKDRHGKEITKRYTPYEATQRQREMERGMRYTRATAKGMNAAGQAEEYTALKSRYRSQRKEYERFSAAMGLQPDWNRVYVDGLGRV